MAVDKQWIFSYEQFQNTPSKEDGVDFKKELFYRQQTASTIQDLGQKLSVTQLCINTAIVYMHRFYMLHSFKKHARNTIATACLFLAAKIEEQPRKLEHLIRYTGIVTGSETKIPDLKSKEYIEKAQELVEYESFLLQTLGFDLTIIHPHIHVMETCNLVRAPKDLAQTSYFLATNSLHLTTFCLQYIPKVISVVCIHLACKWSNWEIPESSEGKPWWYYTDTTITNELIEKLTIEFLAVLDNCPSKLKSKIMQRETKQCEDSSGQVNTLSNQTFTKFGLENKIGKIKESTSEKVVENSHHNHVNKLRPPHLPKTDLNEEKRSHSERREMKTDSNHNTHMHHHHSNYHNHHHHNNNNHQHENNNLQKDNNQLSKKQKTTITSNNSNNNNNNVTSIKEKSNVSSKNLIKESSLVLETQPVILTTKSSIKNINAQNENITNETAIIKSKKEECLNLILPKHIQESINLPSPLSPLNKPKLAMTEKSIDIQKEIPLEQRIIEKDEKSVDKSDLKLLIKRVPSEISSPLINELGSSTSNSHKNKKKKHKEHKHKKNKQKEKKKSKKRSHSQSSNESPNRSKLSKIEHINGAMKFNMPPTPVSLIERKKK